MSYIEIMPSTLANQISAGEVVERPASVVKELVENAIDANSSKIEVIVKEAGLNSIKVIDNGDGLPYQEVENAFKRHATSKIYSNEDLFRIKSLGFRGEALPSIASVSKLTIDTAQNGEKGKYLKLHGGEIIEESSSSSRQGTSISVEEIFYNTPARLKYVKSLKTELSHISDVVNRMALANPSISFKLVSDGSTLLKTVGNGDLRQAIAGIYGVNIGKKMKSISGENFDFNISGYVSLPDLTRASNNYMTTVVNGRYVKNFALNRAIERGYGSKIMVGRHPIAVIHIEMDPLLVDVNVHPTKEQVRISNEKELGRLIEDSIRERMSDEVRIPSGLENIYQAKRDNTKSEQTNFDFSTFSVKENFPDTAVDQETDDSRAFEDSSNEPSYSEDIANTNAVHKDTVSDQDLSIHVDEEPLKTAEKTLKEQPDDRNFPFLNYIGQMHGTYLLAQNNQGLYILDQHAAQERIKYEYYRSTIDQSGTALQDLLVPIVLEYPTSDFLIIKENLDQLEACGIHLDEFGNNSFLLRSHPTWFESGQEEGIVREMIDFLLENKEITTSKFREATAVMMSCKRSIKANHNLSSSEAIQLIQDLSHTENPYNCPHGRPVLVSLSNKEMEKMFKRIQDPH